MRHFDSTKRVHKSNVPLVLNELKGQSSWIYLLYFVDFAAFVPPRLEFEGYRLTKEFGGVADGPGESLVSRPWLACHSIKKFGCRRHPFKGIVTRRRNRWAWPHGWGPHETDIKTIQVKS
jgi:hypothetical protein